MGEGKSYHTVYGFDNPSKFQTGQGFHRKDLDVYGDGMDKDISLYRNDFGSRNQKGFSEMNLASNKDEHDDLNEEDFDGHPERKRLSRSAKSQGDLLSQNAARTSRQPRSKSQSDLLNARNCVLDFDSESTDRYNARSKSQSDFGGERKRRHKVHELEKTKIIQDEFERSDSLIENNSTYNKSSLHASSTQRLSVKEMCNQIERHNSQAHRKSDSEQVVKTRETLHDAFVDKRLDSRNLNKKHGFITKKGKPLHDIDLNTSLHGSRSVTNLHALTSNFRPYYSSLSASHFSSTDQASSASFKDRHRFSASNPSLQKVAHYETSFGPQNQTVTRVYYTDGPGAKSSSKNTDTREKVCLETQFDKEVGLEKSALDNITDYPRSKSFSSKADLETSIAWEHVSENKSAQKKKEHLKDLSKSDASIYQESTWNQRSASNNLDSKSVSGYSTKSVVKSYGLDLLSENYLSASDAESIENSSLVDLPNAVEEHTWPHNQESFKEENRYGLNPYNANY